MVFWSECLVTKAHRLFAARLTEGEAMSDLCREFDISRKTGT